MGRIDRDTVQKILDAADIVEVVSDFVSLKRRGANYIGLCPFHNERTPSFSVSKSKGICKCFSCGKGGSPVNFLMELEQLSFNEALRYLAKKYSIEIVEHELTDAERQAASQREALLAINQFALEHFERNLADTEPGRTIGYSYFRERGINDLMIKRFHLGYALDEPEALSRAALLKGYTEANLVESGLCSRTARGTLFDRFMGRVIYPVFGLSGKVVAFGGRTLRSEKNISKYVNSPETPIYSKSRELYGLYQAKGAIVKKDKCILVEGYMDVISMAQVGVENVVASSGTSLTQGQIRLIHRFTNNVTVIYDSDPAGIKASLRGIDLLLAEGMDIKVLLLPEGDDPDSFAQHHSATEVEDYIATNETDFIRFKTSILMKGCENDPIRRANVITDIIRSIAVIPDAIKRQVYIQECARTLNIDEKVLAQQLAKAMAQNNEKAYDEQKRKEAQDSIADIVQSESTTPQPLKDTAQPVASPPLAPATGTDSAKARRDARLEAYEREIVRYIIKYGFYTFCEMKDADDNNIPTTVIEFFSGEFEREQILLSNVTYINVFNKAVDLFRQDWPTAFEKANENINAQIKQLHQQGIEQIRNEARDMTDIHARELALDDNLEKERATQVDDFATNYLRQKLLNDPDDTVRKLATELVTSKHRLSKVHSKYTHVESERDKLVDLCPRAFYELTNATLACDIADLIERISEAQQTGTAEQMNGLITQLMEKKAISQNFARYLGERVITPK